MSADALELALALRQAPIQRFTLRDRPLPENIGEALQLASAMQPQLEATAARFSESEEAIVEAVRFYLHQVLFEPGTEAYRVLGLNPDAEFSLIRQHHIWLQRWLHPDRRGEDWEAVLATKVNWAWQQLRNEASREKYDQTLPSEVEPSAADNANAIVVQAPAWSIAPVAKPQAHWLRRVAICSLMILCVCLFYLAVTRQDRVDPDALASQALDSSSPIRPRVPFDADHRPSELNAVVPEPVLKTAPPAADVAKPELSTRAVHVDVPATVVSQQGRTRVRGGGTIGHAEVSPVAADLQAQTTRSDAHGSTARTVASDAIEVRPSSGEIGETDGSVAAQARSSSEQRMAENVRLGNQRAPQRIATVEPKLTLAASEPVVVVDPRPQMQMANVSNGKSGQNADVAAMAPTLMKTADVVAVAPVPEPVTRIEHSEPVEAPSDVFDTAASGPIEAPVLQEVASLPVPPIQPTPEELSRETLARFELARQRVRRLIDYFRGQKIRTTGWDDGQGQHTIERARSSLRSRNGQANTDKFALDPPTWRITNTLVSLHAGYHVDAKREATESGQFMLKMAWRDGDWKITRIEVLPSR